jgi:hypothetical protein
VDPSPPQDIQRGVEEYPCTFIRPALRSRLRVPRGELIPRLAVDLRGDLVASPANRDDLENRMRADRRRRVRTKGQPLTANALGCLDRQSYVLLSPFALAVTYHSGPRPSPLPQSSLIKILSEKLDSTSVRAKI